MSSCGDSDNATTSQLYFLSPSVALGEPRQEIAQRTARALCRCTGAEADERAQIHSEGEMMDAKIKAKWLKALRSGKYKQTRGRVHRGDGHCCLGVLHCVMGRPRYRNSDLDLTDMFVGGGLTKWQAKALVALNDDKKWGFLDIAEWIEEHI